jgi:hypothetical protein
MKLSVVAAVLGGALALTGCASTVAGSSANSSISSGSDSSGTSAPVASPTATPDGTLVVNAAGAILPDSARTPGATNPAVTQADIRSTICVSGWTATIRPNSSATTALKIQQLATGYAYNGDQNTADYEEDHLISLELGGAPDDARNLWPEPYQATDGARTKDLIENKLHVLVCAGTLTLAVAQEDIATDWWSAYETYVAGVTTSAPPAAGQTPAAAPVQAAPPPTSTTKAVTPGAFCSPAGATGVSAKGVAYTCKTSATDTRNRWRQ